MKGYHLVNLNYLELPNEVTLNLTCHDQLTYYSSVRLSPAFYINTRQLTC